MPVVFGTAIRFIGSEVRKSAPASVKMPLRDQVGATSAPQMTSSTMSPSFGDGAVPVRAKQRDELQHGAIAAACGVGRAVGVEEKGHDFRRRL